MASSVVGPEVPGLVVEVDGVDDADVAAVPVEKVAAFPGMDGFNVGHLASFQSLQWAACYWH